MKPNVAVIGASGYTGSELVRILMNHPGVRLRSITSESHKGKHFSDIHPHLKGICDKILISADTLDDSGLELVFLALPHGVSMKFAKRFYERDIKIIDLSGDFRLSSEEVYTDWYGMKHLSPELIKNAVYGLPELFRNKISGGQLVANPGCYPTSAILALAPLLANGLISHQGIVVDSKSGVTGAGAKAKSITHFPTANENFRAYGIGKHRHTPEMEEILSSKMQWKYRHRELNILFTPHLTPLNRGILSTAYCNSKPGLEQTQINDAYETFYAKEPFVRIREKPPSVQGVRGSNYCDINVQLVPRTKRVIVTSAIDNLVKGAAGQAVQNMNLMMKFDETTGLNTPPLAP